MPKPGGSAALRRSARINIRVPVTVSGTLPDGKPFSEETFILTVSKYGARLKTQHPMKVGAELSVKPRQARESARFRVVWTGREGTPRHGEVGIEYVQVSNLLGMTFPE